MTAATRLSRKQQHAKIRLAAARARMAMLEPLDRSIADAEDYYRRLNGGN